MSMKNSNETNGNRTRDLPTCSTVPQITAPPAACPIKYIYCILYQFIIVTGSGEEIIRDVTIGVYVTDAVVTL
jgi:hypothetical protein